VVQNLAGVRRASLGAVAALVGLFAGVSARAQDPITWTLTPPLHDAFVRQLSPGAGYGSAGALAVGGTNSVNTLGQPRGRFDSMLRFDAGPAAQFFDAAFGIGGWTITDVTLRVVEDGEPNNALLPHGAGTFEVRWFSNDNWVQGAGTAGMPAVAGGDEMSWNYLQSLLALPETTEAPLGVFSNTLASGPHDYDLSTDPAFVSDIVAGGSVALHLQPVSGTIGFVFNAGDFGEPGTWPTLLVTAVPEPSGVLTVSAVLALVLARRRS
jgi:hypothetical protein